MMQTSAYPLALAALTRQVACARTMPTQSHLSKAKTLACNAHRWQQMMRARVGIDTSKSWADWADEEEEAVTPIVTFASKVKLKLGSSPEKMLYKSVAPEPLHFAADMSGEQPSPPSTSITNTETFDGSVRSHPTGPHPHAPQD